MSRQTRAMQLAEIVRSRRMIRSYDPDRPVDRAQVAELLDLALRAPSAGHTQGWQFLVLDDRTSVARFWSATTDLESSDEDDHWLRGMRTAPVLVVCFSDREAYLDRYAKPDKGWTDRATSRWPIPYWHVDTGMAAMILLLAARDAGLGACFFGVPGVRWPDLRAAFGVPHRLEPVGVVSLGYPAPHRTSSPAGRGRRAFEDVVVYGSFGTEPSG